MLKTKQTAAFTEMITHKKNPQEHEENIFISKTPNDSSLSSELGVFCTKHFYEVSLSPTTEDSRWV